MECDESRGEETKMLGNQIGNMVEPAETGQGMTRINPQSGSATGAIITRQIDGGTDLAFAKPATRFTTILYDHRGPGHIIGQGCPKLGQLELP
jgi:hypothetical protein